MPGQPHPAPGFRTVIAGICAKIESGEYVAGQRLPSPADLEVEYGVRTTTIKKALSILKDRGTLRGAKGIGTFVVGQECDPDQV